MSFLWNQLLAQNVDAVLAVIVKLPGEAFFAKINIHVTIFVWGRGWGAGTEKWWGHVRMATVGMRGWDVLSAKIWENYVELR